MGPWESVAATGQAPTQLQAMRAHPLDWWIEGLEAAVARGFGISIRGPASGTCSSRILGSKGVSVPARRPVEPAHVRAVVRFVDHEGGMVPDVPYRFTIRPLPEDEGGRSSDRVSRPPLHVGRRDELRMRPRTASTSCGAGTGDVRRGPSGPPPTRSAMARAAGRRCPDPGSAVQDSRAVRPGTRASRYPRRQMTATL